MNNGTNLIGTERIYDQTGKCRQYSDANQRKEAHTQTCMYWATIQLEQQKEPQHAETSSYVQRSSSRCCTRCIHHHRAGSAPGAICCPGCGFATILSCWSRWPQSAWCWGCWCGCRTCGTRSWSTARRQRWRWGWWGVWCPHYVRMMLPCKCSSDLGQRKDANDECRLSAPWSLIFVPVYFLEPAK